MIVNELDKQISDILFGPEEKAGVSQTVEEIKALLEDLCEELKQLWGQKGFTDDLAKELIDDCLRLATRPLEEYDWDDLKSDHLITLFSMASSVKEFREAVSWADRSKDIEVRVFLRKVESEKHLFFINEEVEHLDGMAFSLLRWLNARNTLLHAYRNR
ncbi:hypothetical protein ACOSZF_20350 [Cytobacillus firmus]|uniref:hypothetical protein n=1 Tax=Cytobacillus firmus TaxID=1399 RepID=UPI003BA3CE61